MTCAGCRSGHCAVEDHRRHHDRGKAGAAEGAEDLDRRGPELRPAVDHHGFLALDETESEERCVAEAHNAGETGELPVNGPGHIFENDKTQNDTKRHSHFLPA